MLGSYLSTAKSLRRCFTLRNGQQQTSRANRKKRSNKMNYFIGLVFLGGASWMHWLVNKLMFFNNSVCTASMATESHNKSTIHERLKGLSRRVIIWQHPVFWVAAASSQGQGQFIPCRRQVEMQRIWFVAYIKHHSSLQFKGAVCKTVDCWVSLAGCQILLLWVGGRPNLPDLYW